MLEFIVGLLMGIVLVPVGALLIAYLIPEPILEWEDE
jgi:hypothetical protein